MWVTYSGRWALGSVLQRENDSVSKMERSVKTTVTVAEENDSELG